MMVNRDLADTNHKGNHNDLTADLLANNRVNVLTSTQAAELLGVSSSNTVKNWLHGGHFPGAYKAADGHWRFPLEEVEAVRSRLSLLHERNSRRDLMPDDYDNDIANIPFS